jgi:hypothetical protein
MPKAVPFACLRNTSTHGGSSAVVPVARLTEAEVQIVAYGALLELLHTAQQLLALTTERNIDAQ